MRALLLALVLLSSLNANARLATPADLPSVSEMERADIRVDKKGHSRILIERLIRINNDEGRERDSTQVIDFNAQSMRLKILSATVINGEKSTPVDKKNFEIKPLGDFSRYFDTQKRAKINFPNVQVGSKIHLKYEIANVEVPEEGFYSFAAGFAGWYLEKYNARIVSELPLYAWKQDISDLLDIRVSREKKLYVAEVKLKSPATFVTTQEESPYMRPERAPTFLISSLEKWSDYARSTISFQEKLLKAKLPASMERIRARAAGEKTDLARLNQVAALIGQEYRYFGDWRRRNGGFVPRSLNEIETSQYGDCKDLSLTAVAIYRALGYKADMAWVVRSEIENAPPAGIYTKPVEWFNHAVARVEAADGKVYWIDATNPVTYAATPPQDISGRPAFILRAGGGWIEPIPKLEASSSTWSRSYRYERSADSAWKVAGTLKLEGRAAIQTTSNGFFKPVENVNYDLTRFLSTGLKVRDSTIGDFPRGSRIVTDLEIPFSYVLSEIGLRSSAGVGLIRWREPGIERLLEETRDRASDLFIEAPGTYRSREEVKGMKIVGSENLNCDLKSEWVEATHALTESPTGVSSEMTFKILKPIVPNEVLATESFQKFQRQLRDCFFFTAIILQPKL